MSNLYAFQGMEKDDENKGEGNSYTTEYRQYDPRLGRWLTLDPLMSKYPSHSPFAAFNDNPIFFIDPNGLEGVDPKIKSDVPTVNQNLRQVNVEGNRLSQRKIDRNQKRMLLGRGKYKGSEFDERRASASSYEMGRDLMERGKLRTDQFTSLYNENGWASHDFNTKRGFGTNASYSAKGAESNWMYDAQGFVDAVGSLVQTGIVMVATLPMGGAGGAFTRGLTDGASNLAGQYASFGNFSDIDYFGVVVSTVSGATMKNPWKSAVIGGALDATIDVNGKGRVSILAKNKSIEQAKNDMLWNTMGSFASNRIKSFGSNSIGAEIINFGINGSTNYLNSESGKSIK